MSDEINTTPDNCPFCGSGAELKQITDEDAGENFGAYYVECRVCHCTTDLRFSCGDDARPLVVEKWNRRAATARLIAAAPDLLEALRVALPLIDTKWWPDREMNAVRQGLAAIRKAEGESHVA